MCVIKLSQIISDDYNLEDDVLLKFSFNLIVEEIIHLPVIYKDVLFLTYVKALNIKEISKLSNASKRQKNFVR